MQFALFFSFRYFLITKKKCWTIRTCNYQVGCRTGTSFIADKITQQILMRNPCFEKTWNSPSSIFTRFSGSILLIFRSYILCCKQMQKAENICEMIMMRQIDSVRSMWIIRMNKQLRQMYKNVHIWPDKSLTKRCGWFAASFLFYSCLRWPISVFHLTISVIFFIAK